MQLIMEIINPPGYLPATSRSRSFTAAGGLIGRGEHCEWYIQDPKKQLSAEHARISFHDGEFYLTDTSSNGTWHAENGVRLNRDRPQRLKHLAVYRLSHFEITVRLTQAADLIALDVGRPMPANSVIPDDFLDNEPLALLDQQDQEASADDLSDLLRPAQFVEQQDDHAQVEALHMRIPTLAALPAPDAVPDSAPPSTFWKHFGASLGIDLSQMPAAQREQLAVNAAQLLRTCTLELQRCLHTCAQLKSEMLGESSEALDRGHIDAIAIDQLLASPADSKAQITQAGRTLQRHQVAAMAASRAALRSTLEQLSPAQATLHFERSGHRRWFTSDKRWGSYRQLHQTLEESLQVQPLGAHFAQAYAEQQGLLSTLDTLPCGEP